MSNEICQTYTLVAINIYVLDTIVYYGIFNARGPRVGKAVWSTTKNCETSWGEVFCKSLEWATLNLLRFYTAKNKYIFEHWVIS